MKIFEQCFRVYTDLANMECVVSYYEALQDTTCARRLTIVETGVTIAKVGGFLILARDGRFPESVRNVQALLYVDEIDSLLASCVTGGAEVIREPQAVTGGRNALVRHPDGLIAEYFEASN